MSNEVYVVVYHENSDFCCEASAEVYGNLGTAQRRMEEMYRKTLALLCHDCSVTMDDYHCELCDDHAVIVEGLDSYSWAVEPQQIL